jgi:LPS-assembly protein
MKNNFNFLYLIIYFLFCLNFSAYGNEQFNFDVTEIEINKNGNEIKGIKRGKISTNEGLTIDADTFKFNKTLNLLNANGNIIIRNINKNIIIFAEKILYDKNKEIIIAEGNVRFNSDSIEIKANKLRYLKLENIISAENEVVAEDKLKDLIIFTEKITYFKNLEKIVTKNDTEAIIHSKYKFRSKNVSYLRNKTKLSSNHKTRIIENEKKLFEFENFTFDIDKELLKASNVSINDNIKNSKGLSNNLLFKDGFFNLKDKKYIASETEIVLKKNAFNNFNNDPRLKGISSTSNKGVTTVNKGVFTSCKKTDKCPPWRIEAEKITHDKNKKQLIYKDALLKVYDFPIFYFPKFFHPDPSVERQSGFLQPKISDSKILGTSISLPYFNALSENKDYTLKPTFFGIDSQMYQAEYRQKNKNSSFISDFSLTNNFRSSETKDKNSITHIFSKFNLDLDLKDFNYSDMTFSLEKVSNDTYLKIFDNILSNTELKPANNEVLTSEIKLSLNHKKYDFNAGISSYEDLRKVRSDRYQLILPYYDFSTTLLSNDYGVVDLSSKGNNDLKDTNNLRSRIINDISFESQDKIYYDYGNINNFGFYLKNTNAIGKNNPRYNSDPQLDLMSIFEINSRLPLVKQNNDYFSSLTPKISFRINPNNMKNYSTNDRIVTADNIFNIDRLSIDDSFESGKSITYGIDFRREDINDSNKYTELNIASVFRDVEEKNIPKKTTLNKKYSNIFGSLDHSISNFLELGYDFSIDNDLEEFDYNAVGLNVSVNNFVTKFNFIEENNIMGDASSIENVTTYNINDKNFFSFQTRRNRKINLTEYYDLVYEYKNDCLIAGIKYKKTFYEDRELKPTQDLLFSITLIPITSVDQKISENLYKN